MTLSSKLMIELFDKAIAEKRAAPLASAALIGVVLAMMNMLEPPDSVMAKPFIERTTIYLPTGCFYGAGFGLFGAVRALVGSAAPQLFMLWVCARLANRRRGIGSKLN